jgi:hypothetical protein
MVNGAGVLWPGEAATAASISNVKRAEILTTCPR